MPFRRSGFKGVREAAVLTLGLSILIYFVFLMPAVLGPARFPPIAYLLTAISIVPGLVLLPLTYAAVMATASWPWIRRGPLLAFLVILFAWTHATVDYALSEWVIRMFAPSTPKAMGFPLEVAALIWTYSFFAALVGLMLARFAVVDRERQLSEAREAANQAQLAALRFQLNPHFLFNTLNAISSLIISRRNAEAETMMEKLSDFLRATLEADPHRVVSLAEELDTTLAYLEIEKVRFGERLVVEVECPPTLGKAQVPSFLLQPLIENAVKYAVAPSRGPVAISIAARESADGHDLLLAIEDRGSTRRQAAHLAGAGVGLSNVRSRLAVLYGGRAGLETRATEAGFTCAIRLPLERASSAATAA